MTDLDALILAAGRGSRLGALTDDRPKSLIDIGGVTPLEFQIETLISHGVSRIVIVSGYRGRMIDEVAASSIGSRADLVSVWNPFWSVTNVIGSVWQAREQLKGDFVFLHADTVFDPTILDDILTIDSEIALPIDFRECEPEQMKADVRGNVIRHLSKELPPERTAGEFIGIGVFRAPVIPALLSGVEAVLRRGELTAYFEAAINEAIDGGRLATAVPTDGRSWTEIDFAEDAALARRFVPALNRRRAS